ncbi:hypothetical protein K491DRAFT_688486 [Lophiostoma macrostomum CBS 122681]|uniref:TFIIS N-terminal domain-containing protein n=1 Tax=Lophiostoma macrostomum CBS 122681 TaxID=1314788 RepID=A0A6A6TMJ6_9PLEO|nr:hypothetical protein K491DRAFT_688486 [Lophiostoma macrostomum CBS 122681]
MEDVEFREDHDHDVLPEAGNDPGDPQRPEIDEENSTPNPPIAEPNLDMEVTEDHEGMPDKDDVEEAGLSDNESVLSEVDEAQFDDFEIGDIAVEDRPAQMIDDSNVNLIGVHKRKRTEGEGGDAPKKKKKRADKPRRKKNRDDDVGGTNDLGERKSRRSKKEGRVRGATPDDEADENLAPEERRKRALDRAMDAAIRKTTTRRRKKGDIDLDQMADAEIEDMRRRMAAAAEADNDGRQRGEPARHKLKLLPEVVALLNKNTLKDSIVDPETNLLEAVRFFLEPLSDGSLPAYDIQKELFAALAKLPVNKDSLVASGIGKVIMFYIKSKRPELVIKRQAERLFTDWTRPILRRTDDYRKKEFVQADYDPTRLPVRNANPGASQAAAARAKALEAPRAFQRARMEQGPTTYTVVPKSNVVYNDQARRTGGGGEDILRKIKGRSGRGGR